MTDIQMLPLRFPGGKRQLYSFVYQVLEENNLIGCRYIEPYCGGAGLALTLLLSNCVNQIFLNDIDHKIYAFWYCALNMTDQLCELIEKTPVTIEEYRRQSEIYRSSKDMLQLGFATLFLNRTNRSGILNGGPIGGYEQNSKYKIDCRFNKNKIIGAIRQIASFRNSIKLYNLDALDFLRRIKAMQFKTKTLLFIDPPYYKKGRRLYTNFYIHEDHCKVADFLANDLRYLPWILTYDDADEIREIYSNYDVPYIMKRIKYSAARKRYETELLFFNNLIIPFQGKD